MFKKYEKVFKTQYDDWYQGQSDYRKKVASDPRRLKFHLMPKTGWLNDPNGLCQFHGVYHIYYQYTPFEPMGELKMWGHYTTKDFVTYEDEGPVLFPDSDGDAHGVYSGSAFVKDDTIYYYYTGNIKYFDRDDYDYINQGRGSNTILVTSKDGSNFTPKEILMTTDDYPQDMSNHVRDPKIYQHGDDYYMVLGARDCESKGVVLIYRSKDLRNWEYYNRITTSESFGYMWECPDLFELDGKLILNSCPQGVESQGIDYENVHQCTAMEMDYDFDKNTYEIKSIHLVDRGFDFYAPQTFEDEKGRRILIGWMGIPDADYVNPTVEDGWQHALTIPRQLHIRDGKLVQEPLEELKQLREDDGTVYDFGGEQGPVLTNDIYEAFISFKKCESFSMTLRYGVTLTYEDQVLTLNLGEFGCGRKTRKVQIKQLENLHIFGDTSSFEIFVNHGEEVFTTRVYSLEGRINIKGKCEGTMTVYPLKSFSMEGGCNEE
ncbi:MAG: glycoside hydrolase family 32 protein [Anaerostipes sp.]|jgi:beta-fructofuranosidase